MSDLIDREQAIQAIDDYTKGKPLYEYPYQLIEVIRNVPSAEKAGRWSRRGRWTIMSDLISREQAIEKVKAVADEWLSDLSYGSHKQGFIWGTDAAIQTICDIPSAEKTGKWIPCTERLPEEDGLYLVTHTYKYGNTDIVVNRVKTMLFWEKSKSWQVDGITAWMPLPQPYKGE